MNQADLTVISSVRASSWALMPFFAEHIICMASSHLESGIRLSSTTGPTTTEDRLRQAAQPLVARSSSPLLPSCHPVPRTATSRHGPQGPVQGQKYGDHGQASAEQAEAERRAERIGQRAQREVTQWGKADSDHPHAHRGA